MTLSEELVWRGQIKDTTFKDLTWLDQPKVFYLGADGSSDSLTIGNLAIYMMARRLRKHGWEAVMLVGGATSLIGDPGGKESERELKSHNEIERNIEGIKKQIKRLLGGMSFKTVDNYDWFKNIGYLEFLRDVGKHYSMTELLQRDFVTARIGKEGSGMSYAEFSYSLIQGYDYWHLYSHHNVVLQIGGSDQWGNMLSGVPLIRKKENVEVHAMSMPLIIDKTTGRKFGKSEGGAIWLDEDKTSVFKFYQFWLNTDDESVEQLLRIYTELDPATIEVTMAEFVLNKSGRIAQKTLAYEVTKLVHGQHRADEIVTVTKVLFGEGDFLQLGKNEMHILKHELPVAEAHDDLPQVIVDAGLATSKGEARTFLSAGAVLINGQKAGPQNLDLFVKGNNLLRRGKNSFAIIERK